MFRALKSETITLYLINNDNVADVKTMFAGFPDSEELLREIDQHYLPEFEDGRRIKYGFYVVLNDELAGLSLLGLDDFKSRTGYTGADTLLHMRGRGVAPLSKPHLFYLAFDLLGLHRIETGCFISNLASKRSIEKTPGFQFEGTMRESGINEAGEFEDEHLYAILRQDWLKFYNASEITVI